MSKPLNIAAFSSYLTNDCKKDNINFDKIKFPFIKEATLNFHGRKKGAVLHKG